MRIVLATSVALALLAVLAGSAAPAPSTPQVPDFSGIYLRVGNLWFDEIIDEEGGKPVQRLAVSGPNADDIYAGDFDNPILQPWAREIVKRNADSEIALKHVYGGRFLLALGHSAGAEPDRAAPDPSAQGPCGHDP